MWSNVTLIDDDMAFYSSSSVVLFGLSHNTTCCKAGCIITSGRHDYFFESGAMKGLDL